MDKEQLVLDVDQVNKLKLALRRVGYTNADIKKMCDGDTLAKLLPVIRGSGEVVAVNHFLPEDWSVEKHRAGGQFDLDTDKLFFWLTDSQRDGFLVLRCLGWRGLGWSWSSYFRGHGFFSCYCPPEAVLCKPARNA